MEPWNHDLLQLAATRPANFLLSNFVGVFPAACLKMNIYRFSNSHRYCITPTNGA